MSNKNTELLQQYFDKLFYLNPYRNDIDSHEIVELASRVPASSFDYFREQTERLIDSFLCAQWKENERQVVEKYIQAVENSHKALQEQSADDQQTESDESQQEVSASVALVSSSIKQPAEWYRAIANADLPQPLVKAVDAAVERNRLVESVIEIAFNSLHAIDHQAMLDWELNYLENNRGDLDPDLLRDMLKAWRKINENSRTAIEWAKTWSGNENLRQQWPAITEEADLLLREAALNQWLDKQSPNLNAIVLLKRIQNKSNVSEQTYWRWIEAAIADTGREIRRFVNLSSATSKEDEEQARQISATLVHRLQALDKLFTILLIMSDLLPKIPEGAYRLALSFFGISYSELQNWRNKLRDNAAEVIRKLFLEDLKNQRSPLDTIGRFTYGDQPLCQHLANHLDILTKHFTSMEDRDEVAEVLGANYASARESEFLGKVLSKRYRHLMSALHEDNLRRLLSEEQYQQVQNCQTLFDAFALAAEARRYLNRYRALNLPLEELLAAEKEFLKHVRNLRARLISQIIK